MIFTFSNISSGSSILANVLCDPLGCVNIFSNVPKVNNFTSDSVKKNYFVLHGALQNIGYFYIEKWALKVMFEVFYRTKRDKKERNMTF